MQPRDRASGFYAARFDTLETLVRSFLRSRFVIRHSLFVICSGLCFLLLASPSSAADHTGRDENLRDNTTGDKAKLSLHDNGDGTFSVQVYTGAGAGGDASAANQTAVQANAGSNANKATSIQGVDSSKPVGVSQTGAQYTVAITVATTGATIPAGKHHIEFILSSDFAGTIAGAAINPAVIGVYDPGVLPVGSTFAALIYTISAGNATITTW